MITMMNLSMDTGAAAVAPALALLAGVASAALYGRRRRWADGLLVLLASASLAVVLAAALAGLRWQAPAVQAPLTVETGAAGIVDEAALLALPQASVVALRGDGLRAAQWGDLPARPLQWQPTDAAALWLEFPRALALGRSFTLSVHGTAVPPRARLQLLAENGQVLAESGPQAVAGHSPASTAGRADGTGATGARRLSVQWLPPLAEALVLQARVLGGDGKPVAHGPIPVQVLDPVPLQIMGRFAAPSFDARVLNELLVAGHAVVDWQVTLGKGIARSETARAPLTAPNALIVDAAYLERLDAAGRAALLALAGQGGQGGQGDPGGALLILGGNASDAAWWQREFGLQLQRQPATTASEDERRFTVAGAVLAMPPATLNPPDDAMPSAMAPAASKLWQVRARDDGGRPWMWQRQHGRTRISWIGVADWHRHAISAPQALFAWWQAALDVAALASVHKATWQLPDAMPLPGLRSEICVRGEGAAGQSLRVDGLPLLQLTQRSERADSACAAVWPQRPGWLRFDSAAVAAPGMVYVFARDDWPQWQRALRRDATAVYGARAPAPGLAAETATAPQRPAPVTPFAVLFALSMLGLWWREQARRTD